jgi:nucleoporin POM34
MRRQNANNFDKSNVRVVIISAVLLVLSLYIPSLYVSQRSHMTVILIDYSIPRSIHLSIRPYDFYAFLILRFLLIGNATLACTPLFRKPDACEDIPLTPAQRQRLGLPPMSRPATPQEIEQYVTPPRYSKNNTPRGSGSGPDSLRANTSGSPLSGRGTPLSPFSSAQGPQRRASGSPLGTPSGSGLGRRLSYNARSSPLNISDFDTSVASGTPTKVGNPRASVGLNSKWLYEKGRASPQGERSENRGASGGFIGGSWGTGSVFT